MKAHYVGLAGVSVLAIALAAWAYGASPPACPALDARLFIFEPHEEDVRWAASNGEPCRLRLAFSDGSTRLSNLRYEISRNPAQGQVGIDDISVFYDAKPDLRSETLGVTAFVPGRPPIRSVFVVTPKT
jgi:hypothetical protein